MPETGASGSVGAPLEESGALPGNGLLPKRAPSIYSVSRLSRLRSALGRLLHFAFREPCARSSLRSLNPQKRWVLCWGASRWAGFAF